MANDNKNERRMWRRDFIFYTIIYKWMETLLDIFCMIGINISSLPFHFMPSLHSSHPRLSIMVFCELTCKLLIYCGMFANEIYGHVMFSLHNTPPLPTIKSKSLCTRRMLTLLICISLSHAQVDIKISHKNSFFSAFLCCCSRLLAYRTTTKSSVENLHPQCSFGSIQVVFGG